jgi:protein-L-isoaspartate(D-aspartate) O-methyltransferase
MTGFERQRLTMVESQLRPNEVTDTRLLAAMRALPRERFVPPKLKPLAYMDEGIEVFPSIDGAPARFLLAPMVLARSVQLAAVEPQDVVLDVGCATGYSTSVLARLGRSVIGLEPERACRGGARHIARPWDRQCGDRRGRAGTGHPEAGLDVISNGSARAAGDLDLATQEGPARRCHGERR